MAQDSATLGQRLKDLRESLNLSRDVFAGLWGFHYATQRRLELGELPFRWRHLKKLRASGLVQKGDRWDRLFAQGIADKRP